MLVDRAAMSSATTGTGTITLGSALTSGAVIFQAPGYQSFSTAGCMDGVVYSYLILDANGNWEYGRGTYTASGTTLSRGPIRSSSGTSAITLSGNEQIFVSLLKEDVRPLLLANTTIYVDFVSGNNSNSGLTSGAPLKDVQNAYNLALTWDFNGFDVTIQLADSTSYGALSITKAVVGGNVILNGNSSTPTNVQLNSTGGVAVNVQANINITISNLRISSNFLGLSLDSTGCRVDMGAGVSFGGSPSFTHINPAAGRFNGNTGFTIASSGNSWISPQLNGVAYCNNATITMSGTPAWTTAGILFQDGGVLMMQGGTFSGAATGKRYQGTGNAVLDSGGLGTASTFFPGNSNGTVATGAQQL